MRLNTGVWMFTILLLVSACSGGDEIIGTGGKPNDSQEVQGVAQKGPFIIGSNVTVNLLTDTGQASTDTIITSTSDDLGNFNFKLDAPGLVHIKVDGYHFNEITGAVSSSQITLNATFDTRNTSFVIVNVLTHLINNRIQYLVKHGSVPADAIVQAQTELRIALSSVLLVNSLPDFTQLSVYNLDGTNPVANAYLLALSATVYNYAQIQAGGDSSLISAKLSETLNTLAADLESDGIINNTSLISGLASATTSLNPDVIESNLINRSVAVLGTALEVPDINLFIDTDQDGIVNDQDDDDDGDGIPDVSDAEPYTYNNIPATETFTIAIDTNLAVEYTEIADSAYPMGYQTKLAAHFDETRVVSGPALSPSPAINLLHHEPDGTDLSMYIYIPVEAAGTYYVDSTTILKYASTTATQQNFIYVADSGSITITEYGGIGNAVIGSYDISASCRTDFLQCAAGDTVHLTGSFTVIRDDIQHFRSLGSATDPVDLGDFPLMQLQNYLETGRNVNLVSPAAPSYYQFGVNSLNKYTIEIPAMVGGVQLSVYDSPDFATPVCESSTGARTCTVSASADKLYLKISLLNPSTPGAWFRISISPSALASYNDEGSIDSPLDISTEASYLGQVGLVGSYYQFSVKPGSTYNVNLETYFGWSSLIVATDMAFTNIVCQYPINIRTNSCNLTIDATDTTTTELYVKVMPDPTTTGGYYFYVNHTEITQPIYYIQLLQTPVASNNGPCSNPHLYEADGQTEVKEMHIDEINCGSEGMSANVPLEPGKTYYLVLDDAFGHYEHPVDYYAVWIGDAPFTGSLTATTPDPLALEPLNDNKSGATSVELNALWYDSFKSTDDDIDWYTFTVP